MKRRDAYEIAALIISIGVCMFLLGLWVGVEICASASSVDLTVIAP